MIAWAACAGRAEQADAPPVADTGGSQATGGTTYAGGAQASGGTTNAGGSQATGGTTNAGGAQTPDGAAGGDGSSPAPALCPNGKPRPVTVLAPVANGVAFVAVNGPDVYAATNPGSSYLQAAVMKVPIAGGPPVTLASGLRTLTALALDATNVYVTVWGSFMLSDPALDQVLRVPMAGGAAETLVPGQLSPQGVAVDSAYVYWGNRGAVSRMLLSGGALEPLVSGTPFPVELAVEDANLYWVNIDVSADASASVRVMKVPKAGGTPTALVTVPENASGPRLTVAGAFAYWTSSVYTPKNGGRNAGVGNLNKVPVAGGPSIRLATDLVGPVGVAVDATHIYLVSQATSPDAAVLRLPLDGGALEALAPGLSAADIALDATNVYLAGADGVLMMPKECPVQ
jgi:hypothetical protein